MQEEPPAPPVIPYNTPPRVYHEHLRVGAIVRDIGIIWTITFAGGFVIGLVVAANRTSIAAAGLLTIASNLLLTMAGLTLSAVRAPAGRRWAHISWVGLGLWVTSLVNLFWGIPLLMWAAGCIPIAVCAAAAGGMSYLFKADPGTTEPDR